jgi:hypothetical protein
MATYFKEEPVTINTSVLAQSIGGTTPPINRLEKDVIDNIENNYLYA